MRFLLCLLLATAAGVAYFLSLSLAVKWALRGKSPATGRPSGSKIALRGLPNPRLWPGSGDPGRAKLDLPRLMVAGFLLRYVLWGLVVLALLKLEPLGGAVAAIVGFTIGRVVVTRLVLSLSK